ncbi:MAG: hypothetical protein IJ242_00245 [Clostridia bacterium]|nr:hypothetical protein [Clostridia bacterium]
MMYTGNIQVFRNLLKRHVPATVLSDDSESGPDKVIVYVQDATTFTDYYIMSWNPEYDEFFALVDPLPFSNVLDLEFVPVSCLEGSTLFYKLYSANRLPHWKEKYNELLPLKHGIPHNNS